MPLVPFLSFASAQGDVQTVQDPMPTFVIVLIVIAMFVLLVYVMAFVSKASESGTWWGKLVVFAFVALIIAGKIYL